MRTRRDTSPLLASPILVGAVTALVAVVAVFLAYNANQGLPFVPTYDVTVLVPDAAGLVPGNDARIGGKRVGVVESITAQARPDGPPVAALGLRLDLNARPLRDDTLVTVRPRSALGLKYVELRPGTRGRALPDGGRLALARAQPVVDLDQVLNTFDSSTRHAMQAGIREGGNGLTGRGVDVNSALVAAPPLLARLDRVMANLADPRTRLASLVRGLEATASAVAPVAPRLGRMIESADTTFGALAGVRDELAQTVAALPATEAQAIHTLQAARPLLTDATALLRDARAGTRLLPIATQRLHGAIAAGLPVLRRALSLADELRATLGAVERLSSDPLTRATLRLLDRTVASLRPTLDYVAPMQIRCNYMGLWTRNASSSISEGDANGNWFRTLVIGNTAENTSAAQPAPELHANPYPHTAAPGQDGECEAGNEGYAPGRQIGNPPGNQGRSTEATSPNAGRGEP
jgi:virulence factor Mce-like protein